MSAPGGGFKVVVGVDGSETARGAAGFVAAFPFGAGTDVVLVSVVEDILRPQEIGRLAPEERAAFDETVAETRAEVDALLASEAVLLRAAGYGVTTEVQAGHPAAEIVAAAEAHGADLVVVGSHGVTGFKRFLLGSVSGRVLGSARRSVLVVRTPEAGPGSRREPPAGTGHPWRLMVGVDGSAESGRAVDFCAALDLDDRASVRLVMVLPMVTMFRQDVRQELDAVWQQRRSADAAALEADADRVRQGPAAVTTAQVEAGDVSQALLAAADECDADLIVLGDKGKGAIAEFLIGSVTSRVAHHAGRSVLVVR